MFYKNARIFTSDFKFHTGAFEVKDGLFGEVLPENTPDDLSLVLQRYYLLFKMQATVYKNIINAEI